MRGRTPAVLSLARVASTVPLYALAKLRVEGGGDIEAEAAFARVEGATVVTAVRVTRTVTRAAAFSCVFAADVRVSSAGACGRCGRSGCGGALGRQLALFGVWRRAFVGVVVGALGCCDGG